MTIDELEQRAKDAIKIPLTHKLEDFEAAANPATVLALIARYRAMAKMLKRQRGNCPCDEYGCTICDASRLVLADAEKPLTEETP